MRLVWRIELPQWVLIVAMFLLAAASWQSAPDRIPVHWNLSGEVDRYGGKVEGLLLVPLLALGIYLLMLLLPLIDPGRANYARFSGTYAAIRLGVVVVMAAIYGVTQLWIRGQQVDVGVVVSVLVGGLLVVIGGLLDRVRPNWFVGIRTPWTLSSRVAWTKTHRVGGWVFIAMGLAIIAVGLLRTEWASGALMVIVVGGTLGVIVYSYLVWRVAPDRIPPTGDRPG